MMKVSIITVCFNSIKTLEDTIKSILAQDFQNIEYIVIDGGSTDGTLQILERYKSRITHCISEPDKGIYDAMNKGIRLATGDIIAILNSDDVYADETIVRQMVDCMQQNRTDAVYGDIVYVHRNHSHKLVRYWKVGEYKENAFFHGWVPPHPTFFCQRHVYQKNGSFKNDFLVAADFELMLRFIEKHKISLCYLPKIIVKMRNGGKATSLLSILRGNWEIIKSFRSNGLQFSPRFFVHKPIAKISQLFKRPQ